MVVFSPQIIENFQRGAANGLSLQFIIVWLLGDIFNILGAVLQGVLPTMLILAIYYTLADIVLLGQMFYYRGITWKDEVVPPTPKKRRTRSRSAANGNGAAHTVPAAAATAAADERTYLLGDRERRGSDWSDRLTHLNPANPVVEAGPPPPPSTTLHSVVWNTTCVLMVIAAGVLGWWLSRSYGPPPADKAAAPSIGSGSGGGGEAIHFDLGGQIFGWLCAVFYLGSRLPQLLLNFRRKSTEGVSMLFFLFACLGNLTYVLSIFAFDPKCSEAESSNCKPSEAGRVYGQYILVNLSWLAGSLGTLFLDMGIFIQFFIYADSVDGLEDDCAILEEGEEDDERSIDGERWDQRPVLERNQSVESD